VLFSILLYLVFKAYYRKSHWEWDVRRFERWDVGNR